ncbi:hypothetical protein ACO1O0_006016 [Amphichorda felina]
MKTVGGTEPPLAGIEDDVAEVKAVLTKLRSYEAIKMGGANRDLTSADRIARLVEEFARASQPEVSPPRLPSLSGNVLIVLDFPMLPSLSPTPATRVLSAGPSSIRRLPARAAAPSRHRPAAKGKSRSKANPRAKTPTPEPEEESDDSDDSDDESSGECEEEGEDKAPPERPGADAEGERETPRL